MLVEWSVACASDDPVVLVPWSADPNDASAPRFVDLREHPYDLEEIPEAEQHPALLQALRALNAARSVVFTAKCDTWEMSLDEVQAAQTNLDAPAEDLSHGYASYLDVLFRERSLFVSLGQTEQRLARLARLLQSADHPHAALDAIVRPALIDFTGPQEGFAVSLYVRALGTDPAHAYESWSRALETAATTLRSKEFSAP